MTFRLKPALLQTKSDLRCRILWNSNPRCAGWGWVPTRAARALEGLPRDLEMSTRAAAAELLVHQAADKFDRQERCDLEAGQAKFFASEAAVQNSLDAMRVFGGYSYSPEYEIERFYRDAPLLCIGEGTNEIQRMIIAKQMVARAS